ncbi:MAG TPA: methyltransferase domain-containing protein [Nitrospiraceae bacterium]|nr:methyltransferase domain-containing protein [Nitrospiraceae bacterium]
MSTIIDEHREYLSDGPRLAAFRQAIGALVTPDSVVLDLGAGTGILGMLACRAGAKQVYAVDEGGMIEVARSLCEANGFTDRMRFIKGLSTQIDLPERVNLVVADQIGHFGFEAGICEYFSDARARFLKPNGRMIPDRIELHVAPVEHEALRDQVDFWQQAPLEFDLNPVHLPALNSGYPVKLQPDHLLGPSAMAASFDPAEAPEPLRFQTALTVSRSGLLHGIGGWFAAQLAPGVTMSNSPLFAQRINRRNVVFPLAQTVRVEKEDRIDLSMTVLPSQTVVSWKVRVWRAASPTQPDRRTILAESFHSTMQGLLLSREDLERTRPDFVPRLTPWGEARQTVLACCDGSLPLVAIEQEVLRRHPDLFPNLAVASAFVSEVVTRYAR